MGKRIELSTQRVRLMSGNENPRFKLLMQVTRQRSGREFRSRPQGREWRFLSDGRQREKRECAKEIRIGRRGGTGVLGTKERDVPLWYKKQSTVKLGEKKTPSRHQSKGSGFGRETENAQRLEQKKHKA